MAASYNTGQTANNTLAHTTPFTITIPAGVAIGDVMIIAVDCFTWTSSAPAISTPTSGGGSWTRLGSGIVDSGAFSGLDNYATAWYRVATASDPGSTFSISFTGTVGSSDQFFWAIALASYSGFYSASPIGTVPAPSFGVAGVGNCPSGTTQRSGSWAVYLCPSGVGGSGQLTGVPSGTTQRTLYNPGNGIDVAISDSNGSVGVAGSAFGGSAFTSQNATQNWWSEWSVELATAAPAGANTPNLTMVQIV